MEKRQSSRVVSASNIDLFLVNKVFVCNGSVLNLSEGGIFVAHCNKEKLGSLVKNQKLRFRFDIPPGAVEGTAEVVWIDEAELCMGLKFLNIDNKDGVSNLVEFVSRQEFKTPDPV
ncbi:MAG: PilZ domain-containing protein [Pseudomonadota bacterium]